MNQKLEVVKIEGVRGYVDAQGTVQLNVEDVARGLGFTRTAASGNEVVMWSRVNKYLDEIDSVHTSAHDVKAGDYIPENIFYRLAMKASNEAAKTFQAKVADEILPAIRKTGVYMTLEAAEKILYNPDFIIKLAQRVKDLQAENALLKPKADYTERVLQSDEKLTSELIAKEYGHNAAWLHQIFKTADKMYKRGRHWYLKAPYDKYNYRVSETVTLERGKTVTNHYWTQAGRYFIYNTLAALNIYPLRQHVEATLF